jgi:hypothetical protein
VGGRARALAPTALCALAFAAGATRLAAQSIEPRNYTNAPVGASFFVAGVAATDGGLALDPSLPLTEPDLETTSGVVGYARFLDLWGKSAKIDVIVPYVFLDGEALFDGQPVEREISGFADPAFRLLVNFHGAPALDAAEFAGYRQDLIVGASLQVTPPLGQYDETRLVNIGMNRWTFKPELGISKTVDAWTLELALAATIFTDNDDFNRGRNREQDPIYSSQGHVIYNFPKGRWASLAVTYFTGGRTTIDETVKDDLQKNWRVGATYAFPLDAKQSLKLYASSGVEARTGNSFDLLGFAWQYRWFAGGRSLRPAGGSAPRRARGRARSSRPRSGAAAAGP